MLNLYNKIRVKIREIEEDISRTSSDKLHSHRISVFRPKLLVLGIRLFLWGTYLNFIKLIVILFRDPGTSFDLFFRQGDPNFGRYSYCDFKIVHKKIKTFSLAGATLVVAVAIATSLLMNLILGTWSLTKAATYYFTQASWSGGVVANSTACTTLNGTWTGTTCVALHSNHQSGWTSYASKDAGVTAGTNLTVTLDTTPDWNQPTDTAFTTFDDPNTDDETSLSIVSGSITLLKPDTAACGVGTECESGTCCDISSPSICGTPGCACTFTCETCSVDYGGYSYPTVQIGTQCWLRESLNVGTMLASGSDMPSDPAPTVGDPNTVQKWCSSNSATNCTNLGGLYTWAEANALASSCNSTTCQLTLPNQGICPTGWHIPSDTELYTLENYLATGSCSSTRTNYGCDPAGTELKTVAANKFSGRLHGYRTTGGTFFDLNANMYLWSSSGYSATLSWYRILQSNYSTVLRNATFKSQGESVRCIKD